MNALGDEYGRSNGLSRRRFFQTAAGMATAFVAMNEVYGPLYGASPRRGEERRSRPGARRRPEGPVHHGRAHALPARRHAARRLRARARGGRQGGLESRRSSASRKRSRISSIPNWFKEIYLDSDTKVALISGSPSEDPRDWFLTNDMKLDARDQGEQGRRLAALPQPRDLHAGLSRLDGRGRPRHRHAQARFVEGLHGRRQHPQGAGDASLADGRREAGLSVLREDR